MWENGSGAVRKRAMRWKHKKRAQNKCNGIVLFLKEQNKIENVDERKTTGKRT